MTAAPHTIDARPLWRGFSASPMAIAEFVLVLVLLVAAIGVGAAYARTGRGAAEKTAAVTQIGALASPVGAYGLENSGYVGMTPAALEEGYGLRLESAMARTLTITGTSTSSYCIQVRDGDWYAARRGPSTAVVTSHAPVC